MKVSEFDYALPPELIAQEPLAARDASRLLVVNRKTNALSEYAFKDIKQFVAPGDCLLLNDTKVMPARVYGTKTTGARIEFLFLQEVGPGVWEVLVKPAKRLHSGVTVFFTGSDFQATAIKSTYKGTWIIECHPACVEKLFQACGSLPLPPYIKKELNSQEQYQTVYAQNTGAIAAPTAGLHFTPQLLNELTSAGVCVKKLTLHVGLGTFRPMKADDVSGHIMEQERYCIPDEVASCINDTRARGKRIFAVGTTVVRALESSAFPRDGRFYVQSGRQSTSLFITPSYEFKIVDCLLTNFHLPRSTNLVLVSTFSGIERTREAYQYAIDRRLRFYSFGDAMLVL